MTKEGKELLQVRLDEVSSLAEEYEADGMEEAAERYRAKECVGLELLQRINGGFRNGRKAPEYSREDAEELKAQGYSDDMARELAIIISWAKELDELSQSDYRNKGGNRLRYWYANSWVELVDLCELCYHYDIVDRVPLNRTETGL